MCWWVDLLDCLAGGSLYNGLFIRFVLNGLVGGSVLDGLVVGSVVGGWVHLKWMCCWECLY